MFRKIRIGTKLIIAFMTVAVIAGVIGLLGILSIAAIDVADTQLYEQNTQGIAYSSEANTGFQRARFNALKMTVVSGDTQTDCLQKVSEFEAQAEESLTEYSKTITSEEGQGYFDTVNKLWVTYKPYLEDAKALIQAGKVEESQDLLLNESTDVATELQDAFQVLVDYNQKMAAAKSTLNDATSNSATIEMIAVMAGGVVIAVVLGLLMARSITKPVKATSHLLEVMAKGEKMEIVEGKFGGEFRLMVDNLNEVRAALYRLLDDSHMLTDAAARGALSTRADASRHRGGYQQIIDGINSTLDSVITPINEAAQVLERVSEGDMSATTTSDFVGDYAIIKHALNNTTSTLKGYISEISAVLGEMSRGNLDVSIDSDYKGDFVELRESINTIIDSLNNVMGDIGNAANQVAVGTRQVSDGSQEISQGATEQASSIEELTASVTQIAAQTRQNAISANQANELSDAAQQGAVKGNEQMQAMQRAMGDISESSRSISKIIKVIDDIAFQTNILALNAAVEAARAGAHGKGFAVVAEEVRNLAARSAGAAKETTELIEGSIRKTEAGTKIADDTAAALGEIVDGIRKAGELVGEIAGASGEQATAIAQVNRGIEQLSQVVQTNSATAEEAAAASEELSGQAEMLKNMVKQFKVKEKTRAMAAAKTETREKPVKAGKSALKEIVLPQLADGDFGKY